MKRLRKRPRPDKLENDLMSSRRSWGRLFYFVTLVVFLGALFHFFFGEYYYFKATGVIYRQSNQIDAPFPLLITETKLTRGESIVQGDQLFSFIALDPDGDDTAPRLDKYEGFDIGIEPSKGGVVSTPRTFECAIPPCPVPTPSKALETGAAYALETGFVGVDVPARRQVYTTGEPIVALYYGDWFAEIFVPENYLWNLSVGDQLELRYGKTTSVATIADFLPISRTPPPEFNNSIKASGRYQIVVVVIEGETKLPALQLLDITRKRSIFN